MSTPLVESASSVCRTRLPRCRCRLPRRAIGASSRPGPAGGAIDFQELWRYRELLYFLVWRDVKVRYKQTVFGVLWAIVQPVMTMVVLVIFFGYFGGMVAKREGQFFRVLVRRTVAVAVFCQLGESIGTKPGFQRQSDQQDLFSTLVHPDGADRQRTGRFFHFVLRDADPVAFARRGDHSTVVLLPLFLAGHRWWPPWAWARCWPRW